VNSIFVRYFYLPFLVVFIILIVSKNNLYSSFFSSPSEARSLLAQKMDRYLKNNQFEGSVLVAEGEDILFIQTYGLANREHQAPNSIDTVFRIASVSKSFTAVAILQLQETGLLSVHDTINKYLPDYPQGDKISIHHLLTHSSGIPSITELPNILEIQRQPSTPDLAIAHFKHLPLSFVAGTNCKYSDSGFIVLGKIIEIVSHQPYEDYLNDNILHPLNMSGTFLENLDSLIPHLASGYKKESNGSYSKPAFIDMSLPHAAGSIVSTVGDLHKFNLALREDLLLSKESRDSLFTLQASSEANQISYGYGFFVGPQNEGMENCHPSIVGHFGEIEGFRAASFQYLDNGLIIILLSNNETINLYPFHKKLAELTFSYWRPSATL
jgi:CubicO group peptidase (beta-lactamase class C family)